MTAPPRRAIWRAPFRLVRAADATLILVRMDTHIPLKPAAREQVAPTTKEIVMRPARAAWP